MRYLLGLVMKSASAAPPRATASYALEEQSGEAPELAAPARTAAAPVASAAPLPAARGARDGAQAHDAHADSPQRRDADEHRGIEPPPARAASAPVADATHIGAPHVDTPQRRDEPAPERTHERVVERTHEHVERVERIERIERVDHVATTVVRPAAQLAAAAPPAVSATARRAAPSAPPAASAKARAAPDVTIAIGTIELRGAGAPAAPPPPRAHRPRLTLDDYLASRSAVR